ncbi:hypothetical protein P4052_17000 [Pseudomonas aeruginosa]|nr:hypothetical protein [Pseudomonas aeruginosa]MDF5978953.1 hypothetical protein [Pseudomonas aeruginosa]
MSGLMLQVVPSVQVRPGTWLQRFGIGPKSLRPPVEVAWSGARQAIYQTLAVKVTREGRRPRRARSPRCIAGRLSPRLQ